MQNKNRETQIFFLLCILFLLTDVALTAYVTNRTQKDVEIVDKAVTSVAHETEILKELLAEKEEEIEVLNTKLNDLNDLVIEMYERQTETKILEMQIEMNEVEKLHDMDLKAYYLEYMNIVNKYSNWIDPPTSIYDALSDEEIMYLCRMAETETHDCPFEAKVHVVDVALNRLADEDWDNTIKEVITHPNQFCYTNTQITEETKMAVEYAYMFPDETQGALSFHSNAKTDTFGKYVYLFTDIAGHHFYGKQPRGGE